MEGPTVGRTLGVWDGTEHGAEVGRTVGFVLGYKEGTRDGIEVGHCEGGSL
jgi:hypothetical protein